MLELSAVLSSDSVNRYGSRFATAEMMRSLAALWRTGLPNLVSHDTHRLEGWALPTCVSIEPGIVRLHGRCYIAQTPDEMSRLNARYQSHLAKRIDEETKAHLPALRTLIGGHLNGDETPHSCAATTLISPGLASRVAPKLFADEDKDGLVDLAKLTPVFPGVFRLGELVLFAHPYFRRSLSRWNNLNGSVLDRLDSLRSASGSSVRVRLDPDMVGLAASVVRAMEFDYWFGPKFDDDIKTIPTGVTRHEASDRDRDFFGISRTEFWWQSRDDLHTFEAEELRDLPTIGAGNAVYGCRYVHSMVEETSGRIVHLDGAIRAYSEEALLSRLDESIATAGRKTEYTKLWRVDGTLPLAVWKALIHDHFRDNPLVGEYLVGSSQHEATAASNPAIPANAHPVRELVPHSVAAGSSIGILVSLHDATPTRAPRAVVPLEALTSAGQNRDVVDADVIELRKALRRAGGDLDIPVGVARLAYEDRYLTFPLVRHTDPADVPLTLTAIIKLIEAWRSKNSADRVLAYSVAAPLDGQELRCAVFGHADDVLKVTEQVSALFTCRTIEQTASWLERVGRALVNPDASGQCGAHDALITPHGTFRMERTEIQRKDLDIQIVNGAVQHKLRLPISATELLKAVRAGHLSPAFAWLIEGSACSKCALDYATCDCSKVLDPDVHQKCKDAQIAYAFWTDRPARH